MMSHVACKIEKLFFLKLHLTTTVQSFHNDLNVKLSLLEIANLQIICVLKTIGLKSLVIINMMFDFQDDTHHGFNV